MTTQADQRELTALRNLEKAVRACGIPGVMVSGQRQLDSLAAALKEIEEARKALPPSERAAVPLPTGIHAAAALQEIKEAADNLIAVMGRLHPDHAYQRLVAAVDAVKTP